MVKSDWHVHGPTINSHTKWQLYPGSHTRLRRVHKTWWWNQVPQVPEVTSHLRFPISLLHILQSSAPIPLSQQITSNMNLALLIHTKNCIFHIFILCLEKGSQRCTFCGSIYVHSAFYPLPKKVSDKYLNCLKCFNLVFWDVSTLHIIELSDPFLYFIASNASNYGRSLVKIKTIKFSQ